MNLNGGSLQKQLRALVIDYCDKNPKGGAKEIYEFVGMSRQNLYKFRSEQINLSEQKTKKLLQFFQNKGMIEIDSLEYEGPYLDTKRVFVPDLEALYDTVSYIHQSPNIKNREKMVGKLLSLADKVADLYSEIEQVQKDVTEFQQQLKEMGNNV